MKQQKISKIHRATSAIFIFLSSIYIFTKFEYIYIFLNKKILK